MPGFLWRICRYVLYVERRKGNRKEIKIRYRVYLTKFGYFLDAEFETLETALTKAKSTGLECGIWLGGFLVAVMNVLGATRYVVKNHEIEA